MNLVRDPMPAHQRRHLLSDALSAVAARMATLRKSAALTDDLLFAMRTASSMYVPRYVFWFVTDAETCEGYDETIRNRAAAVDSAATRLVASGRHVPPRSLEKLRSALSLPASDTDEYLEESRCVHMRKMLELGIGILAQAWETGCAEDDAELRSMVAETLAKTAPHPRYGSFKDAEEWAFRLLDCEDAEPEECDERQVAA